MQIRKTPIPGFVWTDGTVYGFDVAIEDGKDPDTYYLISVEDYEEILRQKQAEQDRKIMEDLLKMQLS